MIRTSSLYEACRELFVDYPLAVRPVNHGGRILHSMVLMLQDDNDARFFMLSRRSGGDDAPYWFRPWPAGATVDIEADGKAAVSRDVATAVTCGIPIPRNGSLFGWTYGDAFTALLAVHTEYTPTSPTPSWSVMPLAGVPEAQWPPFTGDRFLGRWFWEDTRAGKIVLLADFIANIPNTVFWVDTKVMLGSACCAVTRDVRPPEGYLLRRGRYVYYQALRVGKPVPLLTALLADPDKIDLAPLFQ